MKLQDSRELLPSAKAKLGCEEGQQFRTPRPYEPQSLTLQSTFHSSIRSCRTQVALPFHNQYQVVAAQTKQQGSESDSHYSHKPREMRDNLNEICGNYVS